MFDKYLELLRIKKSAPTYELLEKTVRAHVIKVPFENISKLLYKNNGMYDISDLLTFLKGIEENNFGGTCYSNNYYLYLLLKHIGYDIKLCGADMNEEDVHIVSIVTIKSREYIVDVGYGAPFYQPLARDLKSDLVIEHGIEKYILKPRDEKDYSKMEHYINGELKHGYTAKPILRNINHFNQIIEDSYKDDQIFMNAIRITRFTDMGSLSLKNLNFAETIGNQTTWSKISLNDIPTFVQNKFGIPKNLTGIALSSLNELKDILD